MTGTGFRKGSEFGSISVSTKGPSPFSPKSKGEAYGKAVSNLDQTMFSMKSRMQVHEASMMENLKRGLVSGHSQLMA